VTTVEDIRDAIERHDPKVWRPRRRQWLASTALIVAPDDEGRPNILFIRRAERDGDPWSGHVALPGGKRDDTDQDLEHTARRETLEEVGVELGRADGRLNDMAGRVFMAVVAVHVWFLDDMPEVSPHDAEVADAFWVPVDDLYDAQRQTFYRVNNVPTPFRAVKLDGGILWGMTYGIFWHFGKVIGRRLPRHRRRANLRRIALRR
jgi:8-oxo-dGTP pyrophosphatase MutT (NUDIX family)